MRINKYLSETGACSRREADAWIAAGRVTVDGVVAVLGTQVEPGQTVQVDGQPLRARPQRIYLALHKPVGVECTTDPRVPGNIVEFVGHPERIYPIGRLDKDSEGLILLTNDGDIVNTVLRAENAHEKEYVVAVDRPLTPEFLHGMANGVPILDTVITLAPLLGLLGTVTGMMGSFSLIGGDLGAPGAITGGIAEALIATAFGLGIAISSLLPFNFLNARLDDASHEMQSAATQLELLVQKVAPNRQAAVAPAAAQPAASVA